MSLSMHDVLAEADKHGVGIEGSETTKRYPWGETRRFGMRAWWNFDIHPAPPTVVRPVKEA